MVCGRSFDVDSTQNIISFCTGYGGIELGLRRAGVDVRVVCNVEIEAFVQANLVAKIEEGLMDDAPIYTDLKTFPARIFRGKICGVIGGYPCQPFSSAGKRKGEKDPRHLWPYIRQHIRAIRPVWCFFENVRGHTTMGLWRVLSDLEEDGYRTEWGLFSAEETGAPHQRIRVFILARLGDPKHDGSPRDSFSGGSGEDRERSEEGKEASEQSTGASGQEDLRYLCKTRWPARPGEEQYEWEEPRVVGDPKCGRRTGGNEYGPKGCGETTKEFRARCEQEYRGVQSHDEAQSELGGAVDGLTHRVDRLRLLGNGVVPQTAELAWKTLWRKINEQL
jgi:DNA (cytosine-5)-methyltransferase 1